MIVVGSFRPLIEMNEPRSTPCFSPLDPFSSSCLLEWLYKALCSYQTNKNKINQLCWRLGCLHGSSSLTEPQVPCLNTPALFSFGGEAHLEMFPLFVDSFYKNLCCFFVVLRRMDMTKSEMDRVIVFLQMIFDPNWPLAVNQITKPKTNLKVCFVMSTKLPIKTKKSGQFHFLKMLKANLLQNGRSPKILKKVDTFIFIWETLVHSTGMQLNGKNC